MDTPEQTKAALSQAEIIKVRRIAQQALQDVLANTEDREDDRMYEEQGAGALAMLRMSREGPAPTAIPAQYQTPAPKKTPSPKKKPRKG